MMIEIPDSLLVIGEIIRTQNNRCTDQPIFVVEKLVRYPSSSECGDGYTWNETESGDYTEATPSKARRLDYLDSAYRDTGKWQKHYYHDVWEFVTACFTEEGCKDHIRMNGHNLGETRIYAHGSFRNPEFREVREFLASLPSPKHAELSK